jgi:hypothetical protein
MISFSAIKVSSYWTFFKAEVEAIRFPGAEK